MRFDFWRLLARWNRNQRFEYKTLVESEADNAVERFLDLVMAAPSTPDDWPEWPEPNGVESNDDGYEKSPEPIALHHAAFAIAWANAVRKLLREEEIDERRDVMRFIKKHEHDPEYFYVFHMPNGRRLEYIEDIEGRLDMYRRGYRLNKIPSHAWRRYVRRVVRKFRGS